MPPCSSKIEVLDFYIGWWDSTYRAVLRIFCLRGQLRTPLQGSPVYRFRTNIATRNSAAKSNTLLKKKKTFSSPGRGKCHPPPPPTSPCYVQPWPNFLCKGHMQGFVVVTCIFTARFESKTCHDHADDECKLSWFLAHKSYWGNWAFRLNLFVFNSGLKLTVKLVTPLPYSCC